MPPTNAPVLLVLLQVITCSYVHLQVNELINNPPDPSQSLPEGLGGAGLQALMGGHGQSLQSLLAGAHSNPQILEQLLSSGALSPLPPGMFEGMRYAHTG